jgi:hypothetical protein
VFFHVSEIFSMNQDVALYYDKLKREVAGARGGSSPVFGHARLIFALDATASRQPTWDQACHIQGHMFEAVADLGDLAVKLVFYRGFAECQASKWLGTAADLHRVMRQISVVGGNTQIERVLEHAAAEAKKQPIGALVFVGDAMEESADRLYRQARELGRLGVPIFMFHEGHDPIAGAAFQQIASLSGGAYLAFDLGSLDRLKQLLAAVAVFATGGYAALKAYGENHGGEVLRLASQLQK